MHSALYVCIWQYKVRSRRGRMASDYIARQRIYVHPDGTFMAAGRFMAGRFVTHVLAAGHVCDVQTYVYDPL